MGGVRSGYIYLTKGVLKIFRLREQPLYSGQKWLVPLFRGCLLRSGYWSGKFIHKFIQYLRGRAGPGP